MKFKTRENAITHWTRSLQLESLTTSVPDQQAVGIRLLLIAPKKMWKTKKLKAEEF
jgi:hypothetical protein